MNDGLNEVAGYLEVRKLIIDTLMGRPVGHEIQPQEHQDFALTLLNYARSVELISASTLIGFASENTVPVQPENANVAYVSSLGNNATITFNNFHGQDGSSIQVTTDNTHAALITLLRRWELGYWEVNVVYVSISAEVTEDVVKYDNDFTVNQNVGGYVSGDEVTAGTSVLDVVKNILVSSENRGGIISVYELGISYQYIDWGGTHGKLVYEQYAVTVAGTSYALFLDENEDRYYVKVNGVNGNVIDENGGLMFDIFTYDSSSHIFTPVAHMNRSSIKPLNIDPAVLGVSDYTNSISHLYNGDTDTYYQWNPDTNEYITLTTHLQPNIYYQWKTSLNETNILKITLDAPTDTNKYNEYLLEIFTGSTGVPKIKGPGMPNSIQWTHPIALQPTQYGMPKRYQFRIVNGVGTVSGTQGSEAWLPTPPSQDGTYNLQCVVTDGVANFQWVASV